jgi:hypothetical protein
VRRACDGVAELLRLRLAAQLAADIATAGHDAL